LKKVYAVMHGQKYIKLVTLHQITTTAWNVNNFKLADA